MIASKIINVLHMWKSCTCVRSGSYFGLQFGFVLYSVWSTMPMMVPVGFASITALCVYEVDIRWSVDFRGGNIHFTWRLKRVVEPEFWCSFALTDGISARIADKSLSNRSQLLQAGRPWQFLLSLFLCTDLDDAHSDCWKTNMSSWEMIARTNWFCIVQDCHMRLIASTMMIWHCDDCELYILISLHMVLHANVVSDQLFNMVAETRLGLLHFSCQLSKCEASNVGVQLLDAQWAIKSH